MLRETDYANKILCVKAMTALYNFYCDKIGAFYETRQILTLIDTTSHRTYRDHLIVLFNSLLKCSANVDIILRDLDRCAEVIMDPALLAHIRLRHRAARQLHPSRTPSSSRVCS